MFHYLGYKKELTTRGGNENRIQELFALATGTSEKPSMPVLPSTATHEDKTLAMMAYNTAFDQWWCEYKQTPRMEDFFDSPSYVQTAFAEYVLKFVVGVRKWNFNVLTQRLYEFVSVSDEAFAMLLLESNVYTYFKTSETAGIYTTRRTGHIRKRELGWSREGMERFWYLRNWLLKLRQEKDERLKKYQDLVMEYENAGEEEEERRKRRRLNDRTREAAAISDTGLKMMEAANNIDAENEFNRF